MDGPAVWRRPANLQLALKLTGTLLRQRTSSTVSGAAGPSLAPPPRVETGAIHRIIEQHAAGRGDLHAVVDGQRAVSYRELNYAANGVARHLMTAGFRRGGYATVRMPRGIDLAIVLLAILKAGGSYRWSDPEREPSDGPCGVSLSCGSSHGEWRFLHVDVSRLLSAPIAYSPNLPIVSRGADVACVLDDGSGASPALVPHATIAALKAQAVPHPTPWTGDAGAFDLWMALMAGTSAVVQGQAAAIAAA